LDSPDSVSAARFFLRLDDAPTCCIYCCRHGRVLVGNHHKWSHFLAWDPVTGDQHRIDFPPAVDGREKFLWKGALVCAAGDQGHLHGACHSSFRVVLLACSLEGIFAYVYSSVTGELGSLISTTMWPMEARVEVDCVSTLVGNSVCCLLSLGTRCAILEFDLDSQNLDLIEVPLDAFGIDASLRNDCQLWVTRAGGCGLGLLVLSGFSARLWKRKADCHGVAGWALTNTIELDNFFRCDQGWT
ncbi:hypothetical protein BAE44_0001945, partial [Dichanthelium oligosanthes]